MPSAQQEKDMTMKMMIKSGLAAATTILAMMTFAHAQEAVVAAKNKEVLFTSPDPKLNANKQVAYHIMRDLLEANHWELADKYISKGYIQHNPNAASGRAAVVDLFTHVLKVKKTPIPKKLDLPVVFISTEDDLVTVATVRKDKDPKAPSKTYTTTWLDTWRIVGGKAVEHWDSSPKY